MKISETLIHELLETTRMYANLPYNAIYTFVAYEDKRTLAFFDEFIYDRMLGRYGPNVSGILRDIRNELAKGENNGYACICKW